MKLKNISVTGTKRILMGLAFAIALTFLSQDAMGGANVLHVLFKSDMQNTGVDADARGKIAGLLTRQGNGNSQRLKISLANLAPNATYQLVAFIGDDTNPRIVAELNYSNDRFAQRYSNETVR